jgi:hypothetical protein
VAHGGTKANKPVEAVRKRSSTRSPSYASPASATHSWRVGSSHRLTEQVLATAADLAALGLSTERIRGLLGLG